MSIQQQKDHYKSLGVSFNASQKQIQAAYRKLAAQTHPQKHPDDRVNAQKRFNQVCQAYFVLSNPTKRNHYDQIRLNTFNSQDAHKTFQKFFDQHGLQSQHEKQFFSKHYPQKKKSYYEILGVKKNANLQQIKNAYRKLALKYHPKNNTDPQAQKKFVQVNEAYNNLANHHKRKHYDDYLFGQFLPWNSHSIFEDFFNQNKFLAQDDDLFFTPLLKRPSQIKRDLMQIQNLDDQTQFTESIKKSTVQNKSSKGTTGKIVTQKTQIKNGKKSNIKTEEILNADGSRTITQTVNNGGQIKVKKYNLALGEERPKELLL